MEESILQTLRYFARFRYPPSISEVHKFLTIATTEAEVSQSVRNLEITGVVTVQQDRVLLVNEQYEGFFVRKQDSINLLQHARSYLTNLEFIPTIELIGISGSMSMENGNGYDDIDLFIIAQKDTIWITRFMVLVYKKVLTLINPHIGNKLCFNLFFADNGLEIEKSKQDMYVGHELLQLRVFYNKKGMYHKLLHVNQWVYRLFPNAKIQFQTEIIEKTDGRSQQIVIFINRILGTIQKWWLRRINYRYVEQNGQLWLIQKDWRDL